MQRNGTWWELVAHQYKFKKNKQIILSKMCPICIKIDEMYQLLVNKFFCNPIVTEIYLALSISKHSWGSIRQTIGL